MLQLRVVLPKPQRLSSESLTRVRATRRARRPTPPRSPPSRRLRNRVSSKLEGLTQAICVEKQVRHVPRSLIQASNKLKWSCMACHGVALALKSPSHLGPRPDHPVTHDPAAKRRNDLNSPTSCDFSTRSRSHRLPSSFEPLKTH